MILGCLSWFLGEGLASIPSSALSLTGLPLSQLRCPWGVTGDLPFMCQLCIMALVSIPRVPQCLVALFPSPRRQQPLVPSPSHVTGLLVSHVSHLFFHPGRCGT